MKYVWLMLLFPTLLFGGTYNLPPIQLTDEQDAALLRLAQFFCGKKWVIEGLDAQCQGIPTQAGYEAMMARRFVNVVDSEVLQYRNDRGQEAAKQYVLDPDLRAIIESELQKKGK